MLDLWKKQFNKRKFFMKHDEPYIFFQSQWQTAEGPSIFYLLYRWMLTLYIFGTWLLSVIDPKNLDQAQDFKIKWLIYLTNWGYTMCLLQALISTICLTIWIVQTKRNKDDTNHNAIWIRGTYKIYWICNNIATDIAFGITVLYWALIFDGETMELDAQNVFVHGTNSVAMFIELWVVKHPIYLIHFYWSTFFGLVYSIFSVIFYAAGGTSRTGSVYIYPVLDWREGGKTTGIVIGILVFILFLHCFSTFVSWLRIYVHRRLRTKKFFSSNQKTYNGKRGFDNAAMCDDSV